MWPFTFSTTGIICQERVEKRYVKGHTHIGPTGTFTILTPSDVGDSGNVIIVLPSPNTLVRAESFQIEYSAIETAFTFIITDITLSGRTCLSCYTKGGILLCKQLLDIIGRRRLRVDGVYIQVIGTRYGFTAEGQGDTKARDYTPAADEKITFDGTSKFKNLKLNKVVSIGHIFKADDRL